MGFRSEVFRLERYGGLRLGLNGVGVRIGGGVENRVEDLGFSIKGVQPGLNSSWSGFRVSGLSVSDKSCVLEVICFGQKLRWSALLTNAALSSHQRKLAGWQTRREPDGLGPLSSAP